MAKVEALVIKMIHREILNMESFPMQLPIN